MKLLTTIKTANRRKLLGFTLEEVLVSLSIVGITTTATISGYGSVAKRSDWATRYAAAGKAAMQRMEQTRAASWDTLAAAGQDELVSRNFPDTVAPLDLPQLESAPVQATLRTTIEEVSSNPPLKMVRVDCTWATLDGRKFTNSLITYRSPRQ